MATSISLKDGLGVLQTAKAGQKCPVSGIALLKLNKLFVLDRTFLSGLEVSCKRSTDGVGPSYFYDGT
jgi:hypothetical protein